MKKVIAIIVVLLSCFSLVAEDIPMDWYIQIVKALDDFTVSDFEEWKIEKIDEKTVKMSKNKPETITEFLTYKEITSKTEEYYFRFNISLEEASSDRYLFMEKVGDIFSRGGDLRTYDEEEYERVSISLWSYDTESDDWDMYRENTYLDIYHWLENFSSLYHYFYYSCDTRVTYYK